MSRRWEIMGNLNVGQRFTIGVCDFRVISIDPKVDAVTGCRFNCVMPDGVPCEVDPSTVVRLLPDEDK